MARTRNTKSPPRGAKRTTSSADKLTGELFASDAPGEAQPQASPSPASSGHDRASGEDESLPLAAFAERSYLEYAMSVVMGRALPDVADGQKPVQRRILYAMHELGLHTPARHVKSARVVGDVLGKYHPHGDTAAYDALVRQAQSFSLRYPLIDGQGNFGSRDGDGAAAMRYTECRLTPIAELLLSEIERDTVDFVANYDGAFKEPKLLPARLPMLLLNGTSGIGVGMATDIPSHNLGEVARAVIAAIRNPQISVAGLMAFIPGPDLPGGGHIISAHEDIQAIYESGRGSLRMRARWTLEELARGQWRIAVTELPFGVSTRDVLEDIERATNPKPKEGKKSLTQDQTNLRTLMLSVLDTVRDESDKTAPVRAGTRAQVKSAERAGVRRPVARQHPARSESIRQFGHARSRCAAAPEEPEADHRGVDRVSVRDGHAPHQAPSRRSRPPHSHSRRQATGAAVDRQGDPGHSQGGRAQGRSHRHIRTHRHSGRRHPGNPAAAACAA